MAGGAGNDTYTVDNAGDVVLELPGAGIDEIRTFFASTLASDLENLTLLGATAINGVGNAGANRILGNGAANRLDGLDGNDTPWMAGPGGHDGRRAGPRLLRRGCCRRRDHRDRLLTSTSCRHRLITSSGGGWSASS